MSGLRVVTNKNHDFLWLNKQQFMITPTKLLDVFEQNKYRFKHDDTETKLVQIVHFLKYAPPHLTSDKNAMYDLYHLNKDMFDSIISDKELIDTMEMLQLIQFIPHVLNLLHSRLNHEFIKILSSSKNNSMLLNKYLTKYLIENYKLDFIRECTFNILKHDPAIFQGLYPVIKFDHELIKQFIPYVLTSKRYLQYKNELIDYMYNFEMITEDMYPFFKNTPNQLLGLMDTENRLKFVKTSFQNNHPFEFDKIKLNSDLCLGMLDELNERYQTLNEKIQFITNNGLILKKDFVFLQQFVPDILEKLKDVYKANELLGIKSKKEIGRNLLNMLNIDFDTINIEWND